MSAVTWKTLERCRGCHAPKERWRDVLRLDAMPLAGQFCVNSDEARAAERYPLSWVQCTRCGLVQVVEDVDDVTLYRRYNYSSSSVGGLVRHFEGYAAALVERFGATRPLRVLEIGCNDGVLLRRLPPAWTKLGVDPSDVAARGRTSEYELISAPFELKLARELGARADQFDLVTASNCLAHISDLRDVFEGIEAVLAPHGELVIEVHDLDALLHMSQWDTIYHEHKAEWSERSIRACLGELGLELQKVERLATHGGLLRAWFTRGQPQAPAVTELEDFSALRQAYESRRSTATYRTLESVAASGGRIAAYGAAGRANVWLNQHPELPFEYIVDDSPLRVNRFLPAVRTPIVPATRLGESPSDVCLITAWNYAADIRRNNPAYAGKWLTAFGDD
ncbi:MAG TPA: methyltransferase domain-containing protein [Polyangiaceae bacterium]|nr:methyltransferase domain-containing protein [Polyangiaceae bacterium]